MNLFKAAHCDTNELTVLCCFPSKRKDLLYHLWTNSWCTFLRRHYPVLFYTFFQSLLWNICIYYLFYKCQCLSLKDSAPANFFWLLLTLELAQDRTGGQTKKKKTTGVWLKKERFQKEMQKYTEGFQCLGLVSKAAGLKFSSFFWGGGAGEKSSCRPKPSNNWKILSFFFLSNYHNNTYIILTVC